MKKLSWFIYRNHPLKEKYADRNYPLTKLSRFFLAVLSVFFLISLGGCKKDSDGGAEEAKDYFFKATVGGKKLTIIP